MVHARAHVIRTVLLTAAILWPACQRAPARGAWRIVPRDASTALGKSSGSEEELRNAYGKGNVVPGRVDLGGGQLSQGTILFPGDSLRRVGIVWEDSIQRRIPARVVLRGERSLWKLPGEVTLGMDLEELEQRNRRPFTLSGFGWSYEGAVISWSGGSLDTTLTSDVKIYVRPAAAGRSRPEYARVQGDSA